MCVKDTQSKRKEQIEMKRTNINLTEQDQKNIETIKDNANIEMNTSDVIRWALSQAAKEINNQQRKPENA